MNLNFLNVIVLILLVVGGLNWGLVGFFSFDLVAAFFGDMTFITRMVYGLIGVAAAYYVFARFYKASQ